jgi:hypothetical protein
MNQTPKELPTTVASRMAFAMIGQEKKTISCPKDTQFVGKIALVTGSTGGIGKEISLGLLKKVVFF